MPANSPDFDSRHFRSALGMFATGVTVITTRDVQGMPVGFTASSFNSVSLSPPLILWSLGRLSGSLPTFAAGSHYAVNVLAADQVELSRRFAGPVEQRFSGVEFREGVGGAPVLAGCCAWFECFNRSRYDEGDHVIFVGEVERCGFDAREPLIWQGGRYHATQPFPLVTQAE